MTKVVSLSEAASIAIHSIILIAKVEKMINVNQIAEATGSSKHHVAKVVQRLVKENILSSIRGPQGGFFLKKDPADITLLEVFEAIEGKLEITDCPMDNPICPFEECIMGTVVKNMTVEFKNYFQNKTIKDFLTKKAS